jgi:hypothetical protein
MTRSGLINGRSPHAVGGGERRVCWVVVGQEGMTGRFGWLPAHTGLKVFLFSKPSFLFDSNLNFNSNLNLPK